MSVKLANCGSEQSTRASEVSGPPQTEVKVISRRVKEDVFEREYVEYVLRVIVGEVSWDVVRRFRDFRSLETELKHDASFGEMKASLPRLPSRLKGLLERTDPSFLDHRQRHLQLYLTQLLAVTSVDSCAALRGFLSWKLDVETDAE